MEQIAQLLKSEEDLEREKKFEAIRRDGKSFIRIKWIGTRKEPEQIRIHGSKDIIVRELPDYENPGYNKIEGVPGSGVTKFIKDPISGDLICDLWDDDEQWNRHFIARHLGIEFDVVDTKLKEEIALLKKKKFKVELNEKDRLKRDRDRINRRLEALGEKIESPEAPNKSSQVKRPGRPKKPISPSGKENNNGVNKSVPHMD